MSIREPIRVIFRRNSVFKTQSWTQSKMVKIIEFMFVVFGLIKAGD